jgi:tetratricopeptide (TPR) repeat protein
MKKIRLVYLLALVLFAVACNHKGGSPGTDANDENNEVFKRPDFIGVTKRIKDDPKNDRLYFERANLLHHFQFDSLAINDYKTAIHIDSTHAEYYSSIGDILFEHKDISSSVSWIQKAIKINPQDPKAHLKLAKMLLFMKEYQKSLAEINLVLRQDAYNPEGYFLKGMVYKDLKDTAKAISSFQTAINAVPDYKEAIVQLGQIYAQRGDSLALRYYDNAYRADTTDVFPLFAKGVFYQHQNQDAKAKEQYRKCIMIDHQYADAYYNMGFIFVKEDSIPAAYRQFDLLTKISPDDAEAYYNRGLCLKALGKTQEAISDMKQALVFDKDYKEAKEALRKWGQ